MTAPPVHADPPAEWGGAERGQAEEPPRLAEALLVEGDHGDAQPLRHQAQGRLQLPLLHLAEQLRGEAGEEPDVEAGVLPPQPPQDRGERAGEHGRHDPQGQGPADFAGWGELPPDPLVDGKDLLGPFHHQPAAGVQPGAAAAPLEKLHPQLRLQALHLQADGGQYLQVTRDMVSSRVLPPPRGTGGA